MDSTEEAEGPAIETLFLQSCRAINDYLELGYQIFYWRTRSGLEVDFILYGQKGLLAFEIKRKSKITSKDLKSLKTFGEDYPMAKLYLVYGGAKAYHDSGIEILPLVDALQ